MKRATRHLHGAPRAAFSLIELLVAMATMTLIMALLAQISGNTLKITSISHRKIDATQQSRSVLDALATDFSNLLIDGELTVMVAQDSEGNARLTFLTHGRGPNVSGADVSRFLAVSYELDGRTLKRHVLPVTWNNPDLVTSLINATSTDTIVELSNSVLRFQAVAVLDDGSTVPLTQSGNWKAPAINGRTLPTSYSALVVNNPSTNVHRVKSLIVAIATMDTLSLKFPITVSMSALLPSAMAGQTPFESWNQSIASGSLSSLPEPTRSALHLDQRSYSLR